MPATPNITLTATFDDLSGNAEGSTANPSSMQITLCNFGPILPRIAGTAMVARPGPYYKKSTDGTYNFKLWANDQITPANTYYMVEVLDAKGNVVQAACYQFLGGVQTIDLSSATPIAPPGPPAPNGYILNTAATGALAIANAGWTGNLTIDLKLVGNITPTFSGLYKGQIVQFIFRQDATGSRTVTWPSNVKNPPVVNAAANSVTTANFIVDYLGNLYPQLGWS